MLASQSAKSPLRNPRIAVCVLLLTLLGPIASPAATAVDTSAPHVLAGENMRLQISPTGAGIVSWHICAHSCQAGNAAQTEVAYPNGKPVVALHAPGDAALDARLRSLRYEVDHDSGPSRLRLRSAPLVAGARIVQHYRLVDEGRRVTLGIELTGPGAEAFARAHPLAIRLATPPMFGQSGAAGFTALVENARVVAVDQGRALDWDVGTGITATPGAWLGVRNRFWTLLVGGTTSLSADAVALPQGGLGITVSAGGRAPASIDLFAGPMDPTTLAAQPGGLEALWLASLWDWLRALSLGLYHLLEWWYGLLGHYGIAIMALALSVKLLMLPLTALAARWQRQVNSVQARMHPELQRIKAEYRGEEQAEALLALHRQHGVTPFYTIWSLFGVMIQLPVFIGVFDMLLHHPGLLDASFLWIEDLARPDRLLALPLTIPFFGAYLNLLPFLMTAINLVAARQSPAAGMDAGQHRSRQIQLYAMSGGFLLLFYTFPAAMVLYWTCTNALHALAESLLALARQRSG